MAQEAQHHQKTAAEMAAAGAQHVAVVEGYEARLIAIQSDHSAVFAQMKAEHDNILLQADHDLGQTKAELDKFISWWPTSIPGPSATD